jgi:hypothetical protein
VLNYERAKLLDPNDPDIEANLNHVREAAGLPPESRSQFERISGIAGPQMLACLGVLGLLIAGNGVTLWPVVHEAVVVTHTAPVRVSPAIIEETLVRPVYGFGRVLFGTGAVNSSKEALPVSCGNPAKARAWSISICDELPATKLLRL